MKQFIIGVVGAEKRCGCTHTCLTLANFLKNRGLKVALCQCSEKKSTFEDIQESAGAVMDKANNFFTYNQIDYYPYVNEMIFRQISLNPKYNYVVLDLSDYDKMDEKFLAKSDIKILVCGSKPWEVTALGKVFEQLDESILQDFIFYFTFCSDNEIAKRNIIDGMDTLKNVYFPRYTEDPFVCEDFPGASEILGEAFDRKTEDNRVKNMQSRKESRFAIFGNKPKTEPEPAKKPDNVAEKEVTLPVPEVIQPLEEEDVFDMDKLEKAEKEPDPVSKKPESPVLKKPDTSFRKDKKKENMRQGISLFTSFGKNKMEIEEEPDIPNNISFIQTDTDVLLSIAQANLSEARSYTRQDDCSVPEEYRDLFSQCSFKIFQSAMCTSIRSGKMHKRFTNQSGAPAISIFYDGKEKTCDENSLIKILGQHKTIIKPYEDTYKEI